MSKNKAKKSNAVRYDEAARKKIGKFIETHTNADAKKEFGCTAHFAGALRKELKIDPVGSTKRQTISKTLGKGKGKAKAAKKSLL